MKPKLQFASLFTLGIITSFVFAIILAAAYFGDFISAPLMVGLTILINIIIWLVSPWFSDLMFKWFYKIKFYKIDEVNKPWIKFVKNVCDKHKIKYPKIGIIDDNNPTAFTYGSASYNARVVLSEGLFKFLNEKEVEAVIAHELGHIVNMDFIIMTIAATMLQLLYQFYVIFTKSRLAKSSTMNLLDKRGEKKEGNPLILLGFVSLLFYYIGTYLLLFLSRTREYYADEFSAKETGDSNLLSSALIKIAYGIATVPDTSKTASLLNATRTQGIFDVKAAKEIELIHTNSKTDKRLLNKAFLFDLVNPWAWLHELKSTHPLVGKRVEKLCTLTNKPDFDFNKIRTEEKVDKGRLWSNFFKDIVIEYLPTTLIFVIILSIFFNITLMFFETNFLTVSMLYGLLIIYAVSEFVRIRYKYPTNNFNKETVIECMSDIYASPVKGKPVELSGKMIGRGQPGYRFSEDMVFQDKTGFIFVDYESLYGWLGNIFFALKKINKLLGEKVDVKGWFFRSNTQFLGLYNLKTDSKITKGHILSWEKISAIGTTILLGIGIYWVYAVGLI